MQYSYYGKYDETKIHTYLQDLHIDNYRFGGGNNGSAGKHNLAGCQVARLPGWQSGNRRVACSIRPWAGRSVLQDT